AETDGRIRPTPDARRHYRRGLLVAALPTRSIPPASVENKRQRTRRVQVLARYPAIRGGGSRFLTCLGAGPGPSTESASGHTAGIPNRESDRRAARRRWARLAERSCGRCG